MKFPPPFFKNPLMVYPRFHLGLMGSPFYVYVLFIFEGHREKHESSEYAIGIRWLCYF